MMENVLKQARKNSLYLFLGGLLLVGFFVVAVKFNVYVSGVMVGEPLPEIAESSWIVKSDGSADTAKVTFLFFWRPGVKIADEMLAWTVTLDGKYRKSGLRVVGIVNPSQEKQLSVEMLKNRLRQKSVHYDFAMDETGELRKKLLHYSFATYYIADMDNVIRVVGNGSDGMAAAEKEILRLL
ncbi:MAG: hypothetical protein ACE5EN_01935 [Nitrospinota bacterium]